MSATRDENVRRRAAAQFVAALEQMTEDFAQLLRSDSTLPPLRLTSAQYDRGEWLYPRAYRPMVERVVALVIVQQRYEPSGAQLQLACLQGAMRAGKLWVDNQLRVELTARQARKVDTPPPGRIIRNRFSVRRTRRATK